LLVMRPYSGQCHKVGDAPNLKSSHFYFRL
jgi:hypothetical protein